MVEGDLSSYGALAAALAKAQMAFPVISRDKKVTVQTKTGGTYTFNYAPLDSILSAVRGPLAENGLAISQLLDGDELVTMLLHKDGQTLTGRFSLPHSENETIQTLGSAITYLRRYSLQAILGIAAEEDDDGNRAAGNTVRTKGSEETSPDGSLIGTVTQGKPPVDYELRQEATKGAMAGFKLSQGRKGLQVLAYGALASALQPFLKGLDGQRVQVWGSIALIDWERDGKPMPPYRRLILSQIKTDDWTLPGNVPTAREGPAPDEAATESLGLVQDDDLSDLDY